MSSQPCSVGKPELTLVYRADEESTDETSTRFPKGSLMTADGQEGGGTPCPPKWLPVVTGMENVEIINHRYRGSMSTAEEVGSSKCLESRASATDSYDYGSQNRVILEAK